GGGDATAADVKVHDLEDSSDDDDEENSAHHLPGVPQKDAKEFKITDTNTTADMSGESSGRDQTTASRHPGERSKHSGDGRSSTSEGQSSSSSSSNSKQYSD